MQGNVYRMEISFDTEEEGAHRMKSSLDTDPTDGF